MGESYYPTLAALAWRVFPDVLPLDVLLFVLRNMHALDCPSPTTQVGCFCALVSPNSRRVMMTRAEGGLALACPLLFFFRRDNDRFISFLMRISTKDCFRTHSVPCMPLQRPAFLLYTTVAQRDVHLLSRFHTTGRNCMWNVRWSGGPYLSSCAGATAMTLISMYLFYWG
jgi:hypothetical protein